VLRDQSAELLKKLVANLARYPLVALRTPAIFASPWRKDAREVLFLFPG
jgi:hypothetical protein